MVLAQWPPQDSPRESLLGGQASSSKSDRSNDAEWDGANKHVRSSARILATRANKNAPLAESPPPDSPKECSLLGGQALSSKSGRAKDAEADDANKHVRSSARIRANNAKNNAKNDVQHCETLLAPVVVANQQSSRHSSRQSSSHHGSARPKQIVIDVDMDVKASLGVDAHTFDKRSLFIENLNEEGAIPDFNKTCRPCEVVMVGDRIVKINNKWDSSDIITAEIKRRQYLRLYIRTDLPNDDDTINLFGGPCVPKIRKIIKREPLDEATKAVAKTEPIDDTPASRLRTKTRGVKIEPIDEKLAASKRRRSTKTLPEAKSIHKGPIYRDPICIGTYIRRIYKGPL